MFKRLFLFASVLAVAQVAAASVVMSSPVAGSTVSTSIHVAAAATANSGLPITGMYVYLDNVAVYHTSASSLSTYVTSGTGSHTVLVKAWDSHGSIYSQSATVNVSTSSSGTVSTSSSGSVTLNSPVSGATSGSPVHVSASANGGSYPITGMWAYVDNVGVYNTASAAMDTYLNMSGGTHTVLVKAWNSQGAIFQNSATVTVGTASTSTSTSTMTASGVYVSSPVAGATVGSPIRVTASANGSGYPITGMYVYLDNVVVYHNSSASLDTYVTSGSGYHTVLVKAWNSQGAIFQQSATVNVQSSTSSTSSGGSSSVLQNNLLSASNATANNWIMADGAIKYAAGVINPYYANIAAIGLTKDPHRYGNVQAWMQWYINHLNWPDKWGLYGTTYDYNVSGTTETSTGNADSTDSYAATFLSLAWNAWQTGDASLRSYLNTITYQLDSIGGVLVQTQQSDGLTWAKPDYQIKYLMDNAEAYRGLRDLAALFSAMGNGSKASYYNAHADQMLSGIQAMWMGSAWAVYKDGIGNLAAPNWSVWYADATAQLFPVLEGVVSPSDSRSVTVYNTFNSHWSGWTNLSFNSTDPFPWALTGAAAALMGDSTRANAYVTTIQNKYVNNGYPWPWYCAETGWWMRTNSQMQGHGF